MRRADLHVIDSKLEIMTNYNSVCLPRVEEFKHQRQPCAFSCNNHEFFFLLFFTLHHTVFSNGLNLVLQLFQYMNKYLLT